MRPIGSIQSFLNCRESSLAQTSNSYNRLYIWNCQSKWPINRLLQLNCFKNHSFPGNWFSSEFDIRQSTARSLSSVLNVGRGVLGLIPCFGKTLHFTVSQCIWKHPQWLESRHWIKAIQRPAESKPGCHGCQPSPRALPLSPSINAHVSEKLTLAAGQYLLHV